MLKLTAKNYKSADADTRSRREWPKYKTQLLNVAGQNAKAFDAKRIGSMKELWLEFVETGVPDTLENWEHFYTNRWGLEGISQAATKLKEMVDKIAKVNMLPRTIHEVEKDGGWSLSGITADNHYIFRRAK